MFPVIIGAAAVIYSVVALVSDAAKREEEEKRLLASGIYQVDEMTGKEFEKFLDIHFRNLGYQVSLTKDTQDYGADLILYKDGCKSIVQAKRSKSTISVKAVQEVAGAVRHYQANKGIVVTNNKFSENAYKLAKSNDVELWDRNKLIEFILKSKKIKLS